MKQYVRRPYARPSLWHTRAEESDCRYGVWPTHCMYVAVTWKLKLRRVLQRGLCFLVHHAQGRLEALEDNHDEGHEHLADQVHVVRVGLPVELGCM